jgi:hypothetical protein
VARIEPVIFIKTGSIRSAAADRKHFAVAAKKGEWSDVSRGWVRKAEVEFKFTGYFRAEFSVQSPHHGPRSKNEVRIGSPGDQLHLIRN